MLCHRITPDYGSISLFSLVFRTFERAFRRRNSPTGGYAFFHACEASAAGVQSDEFFPLILAILYRKADFPLIFPLFAQKSPETRNRVSGLIFMRCPLLIYLPDTAVRAFTQPSMPSRELSRTIS